MGTRPSARAGADGTTLDEPIAVIPFFLGAMVMMVCLCQGKRHLWDHEESLLLRLASAGLWKERD